VILAMSLSLASAVILVHRADAQSSRFIYPFTASFSRDLKIQRPRGLPTKHSEGALFLNMDLCNPPVIPQVTFALRRWRTFAQTFSNNSHVLLREMPRERERVCVCVKRIMGSLKDPSKIANQLNNNP
jgi:hypothetical protein